MHRVRQGFAFAVILIVIGGGLWLWWNFDLRWRPRTIARNQAEIAKILDGAGWVSPHLTGPKLYLIAYRECADCVAFETDAMPRLQAAGVDTRIIMVARADTNGLTRSTGTCARPRRMRSATVVGVSTSWVDRSMTPRMMSLLGSFARTAQSSFDCAVSIEIWRTEAPSSSARNE